MDNRGTKELHGEWMEKYFLKGQQKIYHGEGYKIASKNQSSNRVKKCKKVIYVQLEMALDSKTHYSKYTITFTILH